MKKALQIRHLRARGSVSDGAVVRGASERRFYRFRNIFAQVRVLDPGGELRRLSRLLRGGLDPGLGRSFRPRVRQRSRDEPDPWAAGYPLRDLGRALGQLEPPDR